MHTALVIIVLGSLLAVSIAFAVFIWNDLGDVEMSGHGIAALVLGVVVTMGLGGGLMWLVFYSARKGHDDDASDY